MEQAALLEARASGRSRVGISWTITRPQLWERARIRLRRNADGARTHGGQTSREDGRSEAHDASRGGKLRGLRQDGAFPTSYERPMPAESSERELGGRGSGKRFELGANAVAGAIAGTLVSIVLHPVDTIKVTIQADRKVREPIAMVVSRIIRQRGVFGLYSGLSTSLASSAPISAIYTASYELVKGRLLPGLPEENGGLPTVSPVDVPAWPPRSCTHRLSASSRGARLRARLARLRRQRAWSARMACSVCTRGGARYCAGTYLRAPSSFSCSSSSCARLAELSPREGDLRVRSPRRHRRRGWIHRSDVHNAV